MDPLSPPPVPGTPPDPAAGESTPSAWLPPTIDTATLSVATSESPRRSRTGLIALIAAVVLLIGGVTAFVLLRDGGTADAYSLDAATQSAGEAKNVSYVMTIDAGGETLTAEVIFDTESDLMQITSDFGGLVPGGVAGITMILDAKNVTMYIDAEALSELGLPVDTKWISLDASEMIDGSASDLDISALGNPLDISALFDQATSVREVGFEDLDGEQVKHFVVTVDISDVLAANPEMSKQFEQAGGDMPTEIEYDVYVNESNELRRLTFTTEVAGEPISVDLLVSDLDTDVSITLPDPSDVTDVSDLLGS